MFCLSTLNSNQTNHKLRRKLSNQIADICPCDSAGFKHDIEHYSQTHYTEGLECLRRRLTFYHLTPRPAELSRICHIREYSFPFSPLGISRIFLFCLKEECNSTQQVQSNLIVPPMSVNTTEENVTVSPDMVLRLTINRRGLV